MKTILTALLLGLAFISSAQTIKTFVDSSGIQLKDEMNVEQIFLDATTKCIVVNVNDTLLLKIQGGTPASVKLINLVSLVETGMELDHDGAFGFGEFGFVAQESFQQFINIRNGLFRPAPNTQALATNSQERLRITSNGDVGIGTLTPLERLDVNGGVRIGFVPFNESLEEFLVITPDGFVNKRFMPIPPAQALEPLMIQHLELQRQMIQNLEEKLNRLEKEIFALKGN